MPQHRLVWRRALPNVVAASSLQRAVIVMVALAAAGFVIPDQTREVYRAIAEDSLSANLLSSRWLIAGASLVGLSLVLWLVARRLCSARRAAGLQPCPETNLVLVWGPRLLAIIPLAAVALGVLLTRIGFRSSLGDERFTELKDIADRATALQLRFDLGVAACLLLAALLVALFVMVDRSLRRLSYASKVGITWVALPMVLGVAVVVITVDPVAYPQAVGTVPLICLWLAVSAVLAGAGTTIYDRWGIPLLSVAAIWVSFLAATGLSDNHQIRHEASSALLNRPSVRVAFDSWLKSRRDLDLPRFEAVGKPYPVFIVTAEGGGLYAAVHSAMLLARLQDRCPSFAQHVLAVSGVSGGSVGMASFVSSLHTLAPTRTSGCALAASASPGPVEHSTSDFLHTDFLAPVVWAWLFPDMAQRFFPVISAGAQNTDRALALERAMERAWERQAPAVCDGRHAEAACNRFQSPFLATMCGDSDLTGCRTGHVPWMVVNVTNLETGVQMMLSPLSYETTVSQSTGAADFLAIAAQHGAMFDLPVSTAVGLSARFSWVSPQGWLGYGAGTTEDGRFTFIDGGYSDGSGTETALAIAREVQQYLKDNQLEGKVSLTILDVNSGYDPFYQPPGSTLRFGEVLTPVVSLEAVRLGRGYLARKRLETEPDVSYINFPLYLPYLKLPLGWQLSEMSYRYISLFTETAGGCQVLLHDKPGSLAEEAHKRLCQSRNAIDDVMGLLTP